MKHAVKTIWTGTSKTTGKFTFVILWDDSTWEEVTLPYSNVQLKPHHYSSGGTINYWIKPYNIAKNGMNEEEAHKYINEQIAKFESDMRAPY